MHKLVIRIQRKACMLLAALLLVGGTLGSLGAPVQASPAGDNIVISQVYGGGGNSGATLRNDFIELYNPTNKDVVLTGWSVRYASKEGAFTVGNTTNLTGTIKSKGYFLIQQASNAAVGASLPTPDVVGTLAMSVSDGKVELLNKTSDKIDFIGYGAANESEKQPTAALSSSKAAIRKADTGAASDSRGKDTDNNSADFDILTPDPRNSTYGVVAVDVEAVTPDVNEGAVLPGTIIKLSTPTVGASVYYSVYGAGETQVAPEDFTWYQPNVTEIKIDAPTTVHTYAKKEGFPNSALREYSYTISTLVTIAQARAAALGTSVTLSGVVTHRADSGAFVNLFVQDQNGGIIVRVPNSVSAQPGDMIEAYGKLTEFSGLLQLEASAENAKVTGSAPIPDQIVVDSSSFGKTTENRNKFEGRLVQVKNIKVESVASGVVTATDAVNGGKVIIYSSDASFVAGKTFEQVTGVMTFHSSVGLELLPRNTLDIVEKRLAVQASIPSGGINAGGAVSLSSLVPGGVIRYTTDGTVPTATTGTLYTKAIVVNADMVIKAVVTAGGVTSDVSTFTYKVLENTNGIAIHTIQGETHKSIYTNVKVSNVTGIITSVSANSFYMQAPDADQDENSNTSEAIQVYKPAHGLAVKDGVSVTGTVEEFGNSPSLTVTQINASTITKVSSDNQLPKATLVGTGGRIIPNLIDTDSFSKFNPENDAIDFFESLESMLVEVKNPTITGPYANAVTPITFDNGANNPEKTAVGGIVLQGNGLSAIDSSLNPQKLYVGGSKPAGAEIKTGDAFNGNIIGVIQYAGDLYKLLPTQALPTIVRSTNVQKVTSIVPNAEKLTIATFNVENFSADQTAKAAKIASIIVTNMKQPDIIGLMEVQDNDGEKDTENTDAEQSFKTLIDAIKAKGGPTYSYTDIAPERNKDGGAPGGNIRVGFLYQADRVTLAQGTKGDYKSTIKVNGIGGLTQNPGRIGSDDASTFASSRKPLVAEFMFQGKRVVAIANHLNSKGGDGKPWGDVQPVVRSSEVQRAKQAEAVNSFVKELTTKDPEASVVVLGDFNDFQFSGTLNKIKGNELTNLVDTLPVSERYSYIYDGNSQTLDHILVDKTIGTTAEIDVVHVNADFSTEQGRVSDHDPLLAQLDLSAKKKKEFAMTVLHTNDTHANLDLDTTSVPNNILRRVTAIKEAKASSKNPILVDAGDVFSGSLYFNKYLGQADLAFMNLVKYDAMTFGNHEFDKNSNVLADFIKNATFPFVSSNVNFSKDVVLNELFKNEIGNGTVGATIYPALIKDINGAKVGIIGLTTEDTANIASPGDVTFENAVEKAKETVAMLQGKGINKIIVLSHIGYEADVELAKAVQGIDIIVGGHSHTKLDAAVVDNSDPSAPKLIVQTGEKGQFLGKLEVSFNDEGILTKWHDQLISIDAMTGKEFNIDEDTEAKQILESKYKPGVVEMSKTVVGNTDVILNGLRADVRSKETNLGNLIADGMLAAAKAAGTNAVIALQNGGGIRETISEGPITQGEVLTVLPFNNDLVTITLTGQEIKDAMENGVSTITTTKDGRFPHIAGMRFDYDSTKPVNERVVRIQVKNGDSYVPIDLKAKYEVATNAFTAKGGDFYASLEKAYKEGRVNLLYLPDYEVFTNYIQKLGAITAATSAVEGRIVDLKGEPLPGENDPFKLTIMHVNDTHAHLDSIAKRFTAIKEIRAEVKDSILLDAGDVFSGTLFFNKYLGQADLEFMNKIGYDAMVFGNHEFDKGPNVLADFIKKAEFPFVSSNIDFSKEPAMNGLVSEQAIGKPAAKGKIYDAIILDEGGQKIGVFGLTTEDTKFLASPGDNIVFEDYIKKAEETVKMLEKEGINKIVALTHLGNEFDKVLAEKVTGIDVIVGGHSHTKVDAPLVYHAAGEPTLVVQAEEYGNYLGRLDLEFNNKGILTAWNGKLLTVSGYAADPEAVEMLKPYSAGVESIQKQVIGKTNVFLDGERASARAKETNLGNLMTDGMVSKVKSFVNSNEALKELDVKGYVGIQNGGGIRASIKKTAEGKVDGDIMMGELLTVMPFGNNLTALRMTGQEIVAALENGVSGIETGQGRFPQVSGMRFYYDSSKKPEILDADGILKQTGERITKVEIKNADGSYSAIDLNAYYFVATNSFMANGGDFYRSMKQAKDAGRQHEMNIVDYEVFLEYINQLGTINATTEGRIVDVNVVVPTPTPTPTTPPVTTPTPTPTPTPTTPPVTTPTPTPSITFSDVRGHWAADAIAKAVEIGFVNGYGDGTFHPGDTATRAQFITMVGRALKLESSTSKLDFADADQVPAWARSFFAQLIEDKVIAGYEDNTLRPSSELTRTEMTVILVRALGIKVDPKAKPTFADLSDIPVWARPYIAAAQAEGLVAGMGGNKFAPKKNATRADVVTLILSALEYEGRNGI
ncbi:hypothetical protein BK120_09115 [Paenibacillus sp. FSL A5-0031]|uniref:5'-nucleotidase C-terminal domain-containing protein n=1 Tax=Paenibacillus sp. FSL A5-0031 TaxID=1920420 RepID=UPI00096DF487|nr:5'-nucleotidase C-terminal domain-containing protein [Paenibacillus sp. FSL A5-0031]OME86133.1 hypothetical protein BK120_09115 [Paenibacillus sp. FSL A5-0031]